MSGTTGTNAFSIGQNGSMVLVLPSGSRLDIELVTNFRSAQITNALKVQPLNAPPLHADLPDGWSWSCDIDRANANVEQAIAGAELAFWNGGTFLFSTMYFYINEPDGSQTKWQYTQTTWMLSNAGAWQTNQTVKQSIQGRASQRLLIS